MSSGFYEPSSSRVLLASVDHVFIVGHGKSILISPDGRYPNKWVTAIIDIIICQIHDEGGVIVAHIHFRLVK